MKNNRILFYVHFNKKDKLAKHVIYQIKKLRPVYENIIFISNSKLNLKDQYSISRYTNRVIQRENRGYDFAAWRDGIKSEGWDKIRTFNSVTFMNDTCFGPLYDMNEIFNTMENDGADFWGMTDHTFTEFGMPGTDECIPRHIQSYFMVFTQKVVKSKEFFQFWNNIEDFKDVFNVIQKYETRITGVLEAAGFRSSTLINTDQYSKDNRIDTPNYSEMQPLIMIKEGIPFIKVKSFLWTPHNQIIKNIKLNSRYPTKLIRKHTSDMGIAVPIKRRIKLFVIDRTENYQILYIISKKIYHYINKILRRV